MKLDSVLVYAVHLIHWQFLWKHGRMSAMVLLSAFLLLLSLGNCKFSHDLLLCLALD